MGILIGVLVLVTITDLRSYRIPNICILIGMTGGFYMTYSSHSFEGILTSLGQMLLIFMAFYPFYLLKGIGAGDVKLLMMTAAYIQNMVLFNYIFMTMLIAAVISVVKMICFSQSRERLFYMFRYIRKAALTGAIDEYKVDTTNKKSLIRLSVPALLSMLLLIFVKNGVCLL